MKKDAKTMKEVAERCTKYCRCDNCNCSNSSKDEAISCQNCTHYTPGKVCDIDLETSEKQRKQILGEKISAEGDQMPSLRLQIRFEKGLQRLFP